MPEGRECGYAFDLIDVLKIGTQTAMHANDLFVDDGTNGKTVETVDERFPQFDVVSPLAFLVKAVNAVNRSAFVISAQEEEVLRVFDLVCQE